MRVFSGLGVSPGENTLAGIICVGQGTMPKIQEAWPAIVHMSILLLLVTCDLPDPASKLPLLVSALRVVWVIVLLPFFGVELIKNQNLSPSPSMTSSCVGSRILSVDTGNFLHSTLLSLAVALLIAALVDLRMDTIGRKLDELLDLNRKGNERK